VKYVEIIHFIIIIIIIIIKI